MWHQKVIIIFYYNCLVEPPFFISGPTGTNGAIRLARGAGIATSLDYTSGVVQVWWNGQWGNICYDTSFGYNEADVICHQLGWSGASSYTSSQYDR